MRNAGLKEAQAGIKFAGRNINNLRYADDTTLVAESESEVAQLCPTLCDPMDYTVRGILQAFPFSRASSQPRDQTQVSCFAGGFFATVPPGKPRRDVDRPPLGCSPTAVTVWSTDGEGASW